MTRLTLDTIGLCGFSYRFNSFYREPPHLSMLDVLEQYPSSELPFEQLLDLLPLLLDLELPKRRAESAKHHRRRRSGRSPQQSRRVRRRRVELSVRTIDG